MGTAPVLEVCAVTCGGVSEGSRCRGGEVARMCAGVFLGVKQDPAFCPMCVLLQGRRGRLGSRAALDRFGVMEEREAAGEGPAAAREGPAQASAAQSTTTNLLASVKEQVPPPAPLTPFNQPSCASGSHQDLVDYKDPIAVIYQSFSHFHFVCCGFPQRLRFLTCSHFPFRSLDFAPHDLLICPQFNDHPHICG